MAALAFRSGDRIRVIKHEAVPGCGMFELRFPTIDPASNSIGTLSISPPQAGNVRTLGCL
jgi:hypothetical protein